MAWTEGAKTIDFLVAHTRLERISPEGLRAATATLVQRAAKRLDTAKAALNVEDFDGVFTNAYDVYRMSGEALLLVQGLRATGGDGSHVTVEDAVCAQFSGHVDDFTKAIFERFRQGNDRVSYQHGGTGLGLALSRALAELMGGRLRLRSSVGEGARFTLALPID